MRAAAGSAAAAAATTGAGPLLARAATAGGLAATWLLAWLAAIPLQKESNGLDDATSNGLAPPPPPPLPPPPPAGSTPPPSVAASPFLQASDTSFSRRLLYDCAVGEEYLDSIFMCGSTPARFQCSRARALPPTTQR